MLWAMVLKPKVICSHGDITFMSYFQLEILMKKYERFILILYLYSARNSKGANFRFVFYSTSLSMRHKATFFATSILYFYLISNMLFFVIYFYFLYFSKTKYNKKELVKHGKSS